MSTGVPLDVIEKRLYQRIDASRLGIDFLKGQGGANSNTSLVVQEPVIGRAVLGLEDGRCPRCERYHRHPPI